jgi:paraquat-inducible protein B
MRTRLSPTIVGAFAIGAFALGTMALLFFGGVSFFHKQQRFVVYFDESIQGLNLGSPVKLRGVGVGRVVDLGIRYEPQTNRSLVAVVCEFDRNMVTDGKGQMIDVSDKARLKDLVDHGLRAQLGVIGLATGLLYVELDFLDPAQYPAGNDPSDRRYPVVPSVPSTISEFQASITEILTRIKRIDFEGLVSDVKSLLTDTRRQVNGMDLKGLVAQWEKTGATIDALASSSDVRQLPANLNAALADVRRTLADVRAALGKVGTQVDADGKTLQAALTQSETTLRQFDQVAANLRRLVAAQQYLGSDSHHALSQLAEAAESIQRLADFLDRNPNALLSGRKPPK